MPRFSDTVSRGEAEAAAAAAPVSGRLLCNSLSSGDSQSQA